MGGSKSINHSRPTEPQFHVPHTEPYKRPETSSSSLWEDTPRLIPGLLDEISQQILARIPRIWYLNLKAVSRSWKAAITSPEIYKIRKELGTTEEWLYIRLLRKPGEILWHVLDPVSKIWQRLPPVPYPRVESITGNAHDWWPKINPNVCFGSGIAAVDGCLYMLGGVNRKSSSTYVWKYDPVSNCWSEANPMSVGRANFDTAVLNNKLFVVGGKSYSRPCVPSTPLQSAEVFDPEIGLWSDIPSMPFLKAHAIAAADSTDVYMPVAIGLAAYRGKLYVPQSFYQWSAVGVFGEVYDPETNSWADMPMGMAKGWRARSLETNPTVVVDGDLYALRPAYYLDGDLKCARVYVYNHHDDSWNVVEGDLPLRRRSRYILSGSRGISPYILTGLLGKLHIVTVDDNGDDNGTIVIMRADKLDDSITSSGDGTSESNIWSVIATGNMSFGRLESLGMLVGCQNLAI